MLALGSMFLGPFADNLMNAEAVKQTGKEDLV